jgi:CRP-like cAMP-binding protein/polyferredoxin
MSIADELRQSYLFQDIPSSSIEQIAAGAKVESYAPGAYIYRKGEDGQTFYIVSDGKVELIDEHEGTPIVVGHIQSGGHFGEVSLLTDKPRSLSIRAITKARIVTFDRTWFEDVLLADRQLHQALDKALAERLSRASQENFENGSYSGDTSGDRKESGGHFQSAGSSRIAQEGPFFSYHVHEDLEFARDVQKRIQHFANLSSPVFLTGESGTGRRLVAKQIHLHSDQKSTPYIELDLRQFEPWIWEGKLFGYEKDTFPYSSGRQLGIFEQLHSGVVVLCHVEHLSINLQKKLCAAIKYGKFSAIDGKTELPFGVRLIFIASRSLEVLKQEAIFIPELLDILAGHVFLLTPLREHKRDIPSLVTYHIRQYCLEQNKEIMSISPDAMNQLMKYDWPGNLTELANVIQRAVMVAQKDQIISEQILLGLPRTEGKFVFNLLRVKKIRSLLEHKLFPILPRVIVAVLFCFGIIALFLGPQDAERNIGITLAWYVGWPLLIVSFFFLPRFWCSICALSSPGKILQQILKPTRKVPAFIVNYSGWIMAILGLIFFWVEIVWNAYENPRLTGIILLSISCGALVFSAFFQRYAWCRYVCPLGALNAIFSMPSILELRANRQMCENHCLEHACYKGTDDTPGCPMFRHPFLVDNNRDCILCGRCVKNCQLHSTQLNLRLAPQELWFIQSPRLVDSFLVVGLGIVFYLLARHADFLNFIQNQQFIPILNGTLAGSLLYWGMIVAAWGSYLLMCWLQGFLSSQKPGKIAAALGYGLIPLVLGGYLAIYTRMFIQGGWRLVPNFMTLFGVEMQAEEFQLLSPQGVTTLLDIIVLGGLLSCIYATYKILSRLEIHRISLPHLVLPIMYILLVGITYLKTV